MFFDLIEAIIFINIIHRILYITAKYTIPFLKKLWFITILRSEYVLPKPNTKRKTQQELDQNTAQYVISIVFWNILTIIAIIAYPLYVVRYVLLLLLIIFLHMLGRFEILENDRIAQEYTKNINYSERKDYEVRNIYLAEAVIKLEKEIVKLKKINNTISNKKKI